MRTAIRLMTLVLLLWAPGANSAVPRHQEAQPTSFRLSAPELKEFDQIANTREPLLIQLAWYLAPFQEEVSVVKVQRNGRVRAKLVAIGWSSASLGSKSLSAAQLEHLRELIVRAENAHRFQPEPVKRGERHLAVTVLVDGVQRRYDFVGPAPEDVEELGKFLVAGLGIERRF